jgi:hypothetical protein
MKLTSKALALPLAFALAACSSTPKTEDGHRGRPAGESAAVTTTGTTNATAVAQNDGAYYAVLEFKKGTQRLSDASKRELKEFIASAQREGKAIDDIKILAWADKEYPAKDTKLPSRDVKIANARSEAIEKYLKDDLNTDGNYATYNMAKRPNKVSEFFRGDDYKTKKIFERSGAAPAGTTMTAFMNSKASKALIMVDYEDEK